MAGLDPVVGCGLVAHGPALVGDGVKHAVGS
jgi:hypothetical protein